MTGMIERLPDPRELSSLARMTIEHDTGEYLINEVPVEKSRLASAILLGAVRQRVMFTPRDEIGGGLECRSNDFQHGHPTGRFPTTLGNFPEFAVQRALDPANPDPLPCGACIFKDWGTDKATGKKVHPRCTPQIAVPMLIPQVDPAAPFIPVTASYQRSAEPPITEYMKEFTKAKQPAYTKITRLRLDINLGNGFKYSKPTFTSIGDVGEEFHPILSLIYRAAKVVLTEPPTATPVRSGGMLSVGSAEVAAPTYTGGFFS